MRRMSRSLNAKIISLVIRSVSEFNLTVTKTPDPPEEYPTNWPTYWFVFIHQNTELNKLKLHGIFDVKSYHSFLLLFFPLPGHPWFDTFHQERPSFKTDSVTVSPENGQSTIRYVTFWPFRHHFSWESYDISQIARGEDQAIRLSTEGQ